MGYQSIYNRLRANGLTQAGALAMMGNWDCESNCEPVRVQGDFSPYRSMSKQYVADVDSGRISKQQFQNDQKGFGLAQWTYGPRKANLYDFCKQRGVSIGNEAAQVEFAIQELKEDFPKLLNELRTSNDLYQCTKDICYQYENPAVKNVDARFAAANRIKSEIDLNGGEGPDPTPEPAPQPQPDTAITPYWPPRTLCTGMKGSDVSVLQALLQSHKYNVEITGNFENRTKAMVMAYQAENGLASDGIAGPKTFRALGVSV